MTCPIIQYFAHGTSQKVAKPDQADVVLQSGWWHSPCVPIGGIVHTTLQQYQVRSGQVWRHTPEHRVAASTLRRYLLPRPPSGHRPGRRQARHARILQIGHLMQPRSLWTPLGIASLSDLDKKVSDGRDPPQGVAPHAHTGDNISPEKLVC